MEEEELQTKATDYAWEADDAANLQLHSRVHVHHKHNHSHKRRRNMHHEYKPSDHNDVII